MIFEFLIILCVVVITESVVFHFIVPRISRSLVQKHSFSSITFSLFHASSCMDAYGIFYFEGSMEPWEIKDLVVFIALFPVYFVKMAIDDILLYYSEKST